MSASFTTPTSNDRVRYSNVFYADFGLFIRMGTPDATIDTMAEFSP